MPIVNLKNKEEVFSIENGDFKIIPDQRFVGNSVKLFLPDDDIPLGIWTVKNKEGIALLQYVIYQCSFSMVYMGYNSKVSNV